MNTIPPAGHGLSPVRKRSACRALRAAQQQPQVASRNVGEGRQCARENTEPQMCGVEGDRGLHVIDDVADADQRHWKSPEEGAEVISFDFAKLSNGRSCSGKCSSTSDVRGRTSRSETRR